MVVMDEEPRLNPSLFIWVALSAVWLQPQHRCPTAYACLPGLSSFAVRSSQLQYILSALLRVLLYTRNSHSCMNIVQC